MPGTTPPYENAPWGQTCPPHEGPRAFERTATAAESVLPRASAPRRPGFFGAIFLAHGRHDTMTWLADAGEMGPLVRSTDWSATGLGALDTWSASRKTAVGICLRSPLPTALFLGPEQRLIYNEHFVRFLPGGQHPTALGRAGKSVRDRVADGTFDFSPVIASDGESVDGTLCVYNGARHSSPMDDAQELRAAVDLFKLGRYRQDPVTQAIEWDAHLKAMWGLGARRSRGSRGVHQRHPSARSRARAGGARPERRPVGRRRLRHRVPCRRRERRRRAMGCYARQDRVRTGTRGEFSRRGARHFQTKKRRADEPHPDRRAAAPDTQSARRRRRARRADARVSPTRSTTSA